jgi:HTH-type transcriptional regulator/antitoxin HigA
MIIKVLKNESDYEQALKEAELLMDSEPGSAEESHLEVLSILIEKYEDEHFPVEMPDPVSAIKFRMEQQGLKQKDLVPYIGSQPKVSAVLNGARELSKEMIRKLHDGLGIPLEVLMNKPGS